MARKLKDIMTDYEIALKMLGERMESYVTAQTTARTARNNETSALNALNGAQKMINDLQKELHDAMPFDSDWRRNEPGKFVQVPSPTEG
jgi:hypothetical protein